MPREDRAFLELLVHQSGVVSRGQLKDLGWTRHEIDAAARDHWRILQRGVYLVPHRDVGPTSAPRAEVWAALMTAGPGAVASHRTALWLAGALRQPPPLVHVTVPASRRVERRDGIRVHVSRRHPDAVPGVGSPPRTAVEDALLDTTDAETDPCRVIDLVLRVTQGRFTTPDRVRTALAGRSRHRWRRLLTDMLAEVADGVTSMLEREYLLRVERPHGLPRGERNRRDADGRYRDVRYREWGVLVELDGREAHPAEGAFRDRGRDNAATVDGEAPLRYGWRETVGDACGVAAEVASVLTSRGWPGPLRRCGPECGLIAKA